MDVQLIAPENKLSSYVACLDAAMEAPEARSQEKGERPAEAKLGAKDYEIQDASDLCCLPQPSIAPENVITFHQVVAVLRLMRLSDLTLSCVSLTHLDVLFGLIQKYDQAWDFISTELGSPVSYTSLAPLESRRIEIGHKRKSSLSRADRAKRSMRLSFDSSSSTKASSNTTATSVARNNWSVSASGSYGISGISQVGISGSIGGSMSQTRQQAVNFVTDETAKSSRQLQAETETTTTVGLQTLFEHIEEHNLRNPYADRTILITIYELIDNYRVTTCTTSLRPCLILNFDRISKDEQRTSTPMVFDEAFVNTHNQFIRAALLDDTLAEYLNSSRQLDRIDESKADIGDIAENAIRCLDFMLFDTGVFAASGESDYDIDLSFDVQQADSSFSDAIANDLTDYYLLMASVRFLWNRDKTEFSGGDLNSVEFERRAIEYVQMLYDGLRPWMGISADDKRKLHDTNQKTEQFRRIPAFLAMAKELVLNPLGMQRPQSGSSENEEEGEGEGEREPEISAPNPRASAAARLVDHLNCFGRYYTEEYLHFLHQWTGVSSIEELIASAPTVLRQFLPYLSFEESFINRTSWVIPFVDTISADKAVGCFTNGQGLGELEPVQETFKTRLPSDGVHFEAVPGKCQLPDLPTDSVPWYESLKVGMREGTEEAETQFLES